MTIEIANRLVALRKSKGMSQEELAEKLGVSRQAVSKWERAEASPDLEKLIALSKLYDVTLDELILDQEGRSIGDENTASCPEKIYDDAWNTDPSADGECEENFETEDSPKSKNSVHISWKDGIHVKDVNGDEVHVSWKGIHVEERSGDSVHVGPQGVHVEEQEGNRVDVSGSGVFVNGQPIKKNRWFYFPYPLIALGLFLSWGFSGVLGGWAVSWLAFLTVPIYYAVTAGIGKGQCLQNSFPLIVLLFFFYGDFQDGWVDGFIPG